MHTLRSGTPSGARGLPILLTPRDWRLAGPGSTFALVSGVARGRPASAKSEVAQPAPLAARLASSLVSTHGHGPTANSCTTPPLTPARPQSTPGASHPLPVNGEETYAHHSGPDGDGEGDRPLPCAASGSFRDVGPSSATSICWRQDSSRSANDSFVDTSSRPICPLVATAATQPDGDRTSVMWYPAA